MNTDVETGKTAGVTEEVITLELWRNGHQQISVGSNEFDHLRHLIGDVVVIWIKPPDIAYHSDDHWTIR